MKKNLAKRIVLGLLTGAVLMSSSVAWAAEGGVYTGIYSGTGNEMPTSMSVTFNENGTNVKGEYSVAECGLPILKPCASLGGSDAAYTTQAGIPTIDDLGVEGGELHSVREFANLDSLAASAKRLAAIAYYI